MDLLPKNAVLSLFAAAGVAAFAPSIAVAEGPDLSPATAGVYAADQGHAYITFAYDHMGYSRPRLQWAEFDAELNWNPDAPEDSAVEVEIDARSIDSRVEEFDKHLKGERFFDVSNHKKITFVSTGVERTGPTTGVMTGDLTIKGETRPVSLDVVFNKAGATQEGTPKLGFSAKTQLLRSEHGLGMFVPFVGDAVDIEIEIEFDKKG